MATVITEDIFAAKPTAEKPTEEKSTDEQAPTKEASVNPIEAGRENDSQRLDNMSHS